MKKWVLIWGLVLLGGVLPMGAVVRGQTMPGAVTPVGGVAITAEGLLQVPRVNGAKGNAFQVKSNSRVTYVSLSKVMAEVRKGVRTKGAVASELRYLQGITRLEWIYLFPERQDVVIAGPSEPLNAENALQPVGTLSHRPALQLDDLIVALRAVHGARGDKGAIFGCSLDMPARAQETATEVFGRFGDGPGAVLAEQLKGAIGPQKVRILGVPGDSRVALAMVTADYRLKRMAMGAEMPPVAGIGDALAAGGIAANRVWFEPSYGAMLVAKDGLSYQIVGPRLKVLAGAVEFEAGAEGAGGARRATGAAEGFAKRFSDKMEGAAGKMEALADLQNVTDLFLLATLMEQGKLAEKAHLDLGWVFNSEGEGAYKTATYVTPREAETVVATTSTAVVTGGVALTANAFLTVEKAEAGEKSGVVAARAEPTSGWFLTKVVSQ